MEMITLHYVGLIHRDFEEIATKKTIHVIKII